MNDKTLDVCQCHEKHAPTYWKGVAREYRGALEKAEKERDEARAELVKADSQIQELNKEAQTYSDALTEEIDRAEKAEKERDEARRERDSWRAQVPLADWEEDLIHATENPRPLTPDAITDEMVERARSAYWGPTYGGSVDERVRAILTAALTEPPKRPEGAERWEDFLIDSLDYQALTDQQITDLADRIAEEMNR